MIRYKRNFHEIRSKYFSIEEEKVFISNIIKTNLIVNLYIVKNI